jgi:hypothetical protein
VLLSDGQSNVGPDPQKAAEIAAKHGVRIYTVGIGTPEGTTVTADGWSMRTRLDEESLKKVASMTQAEYFRAGNAADLRKIYSALGTRLALQKPQPTEVTAIVAALGAVLTLAGGLLSMLWFNRIFDARSLSRRDVGCASSATMLSRIASFRTARTFLVPEEAGQPRLQTFIRSFARDRCGPRVRLQATRTGIAVAAPDLEERRPNSRILRSREHAQDRVAATVVDLPRKQQRSPGVFVACVARKHRDERAPVPVADPQLGPQSPAASRGEEEPRAGRNRRGERRNDGDAHRVTGHRGVPNRTSCVANAGELAAACDIS